MFLFRSHLQLFKRKLAPLFLITLLVPLSYRANAQVEKGVITGTVKEGTGAVLQGAQVTLQNASTGLPTVTTTNGEGIYVSPPLSPGEYVVKITASSTFVSQSASASPSMQL
jgi:uncharacterized surface anchored protein